MPMFFLNIYKEKGISSFDVIYKLRKILNIKKIGHAGTLDPLAKGVLQIGVGSAAKLLDYLKSDKCYQAKIKFGYTTETLDDEGEKKFISKPAFRKEELINALENFRGKISQIPPKFSAIKIKGKKLCDLARNGKDTGEIKPRSVEIYDIRLLDYNNFDEAQIFVHCSKGTYIRSIVRDLGEKLGSGAYMSDLKRTKAGTFNIENSIQLSDDIQAYKINPQDVLDLNRYILNEEEFNKIKHGNSIRCAIKSENDKKFMLIFNNKLVSIANLSDNILKVEKVFAED